MLELIKNPVYMLVNFGSVFVMLIVTGFTTFAPKYLETQFYVDKSNAMLQSTWKLSFMWTKAMLA